MKTTLSLLYFTFFCSILCVGQCTINSFIQDNYELDAKILALRDILADPSDPDYNNPFMPEERVTPYLEKLSALYEAGESDPEIAAIFNDFQIHVNQEYNYPISLRGISFGAETDLPWIQTFKDTGLSGVAELDDLITTYQFTIDWFFDFSNGNTGFRLISGYDFLNLTPVLEDFQNITDLNYAEFTYPGVDVRLNYIGVPYTINNSGVSTCDIIAQGNFIQFILYAGDCFNGCEYSEFYFWEVTEDCVVLSTEDNTLESFSFYPNPAQEELHFSGTNLEEISISIYNIQGQKLISNNSAKKTLNVSHLPTGVYFVSAKNTDNKKITKRFIKQ